MTSQLMFVSPVVGWRGDFVGATTAVSHTALTLFDHSANGKISVQGVKAAEVLQVTHLAVGQGIETGQGQVYRLRHNLFYLSTPPGFENQITRRVEETVQQRSEFVTVTDITHGRSEFRLIGHPTTELLSRLCGLDFHLTRFPNLTARQSSVAKTTQLVIRRDMDNIPAYSLIGARSFGVYLWETILKAGHDLWENQ